jgi:hypothetical protein
MDEVHKPSDSIIPHRQNLIDSTLFLSEQATGT